MLQLKCDPCDEYNRRCSRLVMKSLVDYWWAGNFVTGEVFRQGWLAMGIARPTDLNRMYATILRDFIYG